MEAALRTCVVGNMCFEALVPIKRTEAGARGREVEVVGARPLVLRGALWRESANGSRKETNGGCRSAYGKQT